jgi:hypothetical protein
LAPNGPSSRRRTGCGGRGAFSAARGFASTGLRAGGCAAAFGFGSIACAGFATGSGFAATGSGFVVSVLATAGAAIDADAAAGGALATGAGY